MQEKGKERTKKKQRVKQKMNSIVVDSKAIMSTNSFNVNSLNTQIQRQRLNKSKAQLYTTDRNPNHGNVDASGDA